MCASNSATCPTLNMNRCIREIIIQEIRSIANEFLKEAQRLGLPNWSNTSFGPNANVVPVELSAAIVFDFHFVNANSTFCASLVGGDLGSAVVNCITNATVTSLPAQVDLSTISSTSVNTASNLIKTLGVGLLNSYLHKLGFSELTYSNLADNILQDLHGSQAEYAFNFGIISDILNQDSQINTANATCHTAFPSFTGAASTAFESWITAYIPPASSRTMCTLLKDMSAGTSTGNAPPLSTSAFLHTNMFRSNESPSGSC